MASEYRPQKGGAINAKVATKVRRVPARPPRSAPGRPSPVPPPRQVVPPPPHPPHPTQPPTHRTHAHATVLKSLTQGVSSRLQVFSVKATKSEARTIADAIAKGTYTAPTPAAE